MITFDPDYLEFCKQNKDLLIGINRIVENDFVLAVMDKTTIADRILDMPKGIVIWNRDLGVIYPKHYFIWIPTIDQLFSAIENIKLKLTIHSYFTEDHIEYVAACVTHTKKVCHRDRLLNKAIAGVYFELRRMADGTKREAEEVEEVGEVGDVGEVREASTSNNKSDQ